MRYTEFRDAVREYLSRHPEGATWNELRERLDLPYGTPCPEWVRRLEEEIGLQRNEKRGRALVWRIGKADRT